MVDKVEGWTFEAEGPDRILWHEPQSTRGGIEAVKATLVIGEKAFTESEVRELLRRCSNEAIEYAGRYVSFDRLLDPA